VEVLVNIKKCRRKSLDDPFPLGIGGGGTGMHKGSMVEVRVRPEENELNGVLVLLRIAPAAARVKCITYPDTHPYTFRTHGRIKVLYHIA
jgi:hypothetical protein